MRIADVKGATVLFLLVLACMSFYLVVLFVWYAPYEPRRYALVSELNLPITTGWGDIQNYLNCELLPDGTTQLELEQKLRSFEPYTWRESGFYNGSSTGNVLISFENLPIDYYYYHFTDGKLSSRQYMSGLDFFEVQCGNE